MPKMHPPVDYHNYLHLDQILDSQKLRSEELGNKAHDEMLFIIIHQAYELWFKQILHEIDSVHATFSQPKVDERQMLTVVSRFKRINEILKLLIDQFGVLETMTPLDFLEFREYLYPASGFQSFQFRMVEIKLGLQLSERLRYNNTDFTAHLHPQQREMAQKAMKQASLFDLVQQWLERTPFLDMDGFDFWKIYRQSVTDLFQADEAEIDRIPLLNTEDKQRAKTSIREARDTFTALFDEKQFEEIRKKGLWRLSYRAMHAALLIQLYRDQPILHLPFQLITELIEMDKHMTAFRSRHAMVALRMLGNKIGTGGSSGYLYLKQAAEQHKIFQDFYNLTTFFIPRSALPPLPKELEKKLGFSY